MVMYSNLLNSNILKYNCINNLKKYIILFFCIFVLFEAHSQSKPQSITTPKNTDDTTLINFHLKEANRHADDAKKSFFHCKKGLGLLKNKGETYDKVRIEFLHLSGTANFNLNNNRKAAKYYEEEFDLLKKGCDKKQTMYVLFNLGATYSRIKLKQKHSSKVFEQCLDIAYELNDSIVLKELLFNLYQINKQEQNYEKSLEYFKLYTSMQDTLMNINQHREIGRLKQTFKATENKMHAKIVNQHTIIQKLTESERELIIKNVKSNMQKQYKIKKIKLEKELQEAKLQKQTTVLFSTVIILIVSIIASILLWAFFHHKKKAYRQIKKKNEQIKRANKNIMDSINYAERIQSTILIKPEIIRESFTDIFIFYAPKDIVSGDFYWYSQVDGKHIIAVIDCTGHGVPGAFMSMIGNTLMNEIINVNKTTQPNIILEKLHKGVVNALRQDDIDSPSNDGMDMSICTIDIDKKEIQFAGAINNLYMIQNNKYSVIKADINSIGGKSLRPDYVEERKFKNNILVIQPETYLYMMSDGYVDQFGGDEDKKFNIHQFKQIVLENFGKDMTSQYKIIKSRFEEWKKDKSQIDDVLVLGIKLC